MITRIVKEGDEYILLLPDEICEELNLEVGDAMTWHKDSDGLVSLRKVDQKDWRYFVE